MKKKLDTWSQAGNRRRVVEKDKRLGWEGGERRTSRSTVEENVWSGTDGRRLADGAALIQLMGPGGSSKEKGSGIGGGGQTGALGTVIEAPPSGSRYVRSRENHLVVGIHISGEDGSLGGTGVGKSPPTHRTGLRAV